MTPFLHSQTTPEGREFAARITAERKKAGSTLSTTEVITRAETLNCVGCHFISGNVGEGIAFPLQIDAFQHVSERFTEKGEVGPRFSISPAMRDVFIPHRVEILRRFLVSGTPPVHSKAGSGRTD